MNRPQLRIQDAADLLGQRRAMFARPGHRAARIGIGVTRAADHKQGLRPWIAFLNGSLGKTGVVAADFIVLVGERRVVAGSAEEHRAQLAVRPVHAQDRHAAIGQAASIDAQNHTVRRELAAIHHEMNDACSPR